MPARTPAFLLLAAFLALAAHVPSPVAGQDRDPPKEKEKGKDEAKPHEFKWPTQIGGKGLVDWLKDATENPDPAVREFALKTLPGFGPDARKACSRRLLARMTAEPDPGVRLTVYSTAATIGLEDSELPEGIRILANIVDRGSGMSRYNAIQALAMFGSKAERAMLQLTGQACNDPAYETRRTLASALASVGFNEKTGPNVLALNRLAANFAKDESAAVRMAALQSLVLLGPPWAATRKPDDPLPPKINWKDAKFVADRMRDRLAVRKSGGVVESDKQLEIWCRVVLMRFDETELLEDTHLIAITKNLDQTSELGPKLQALQALALFGERAGSRVDDVVPVLKDEDPLVLGAVFTALASMGVKGRPAVPELERVEKLWAEKREKRIEQEDFKKAVANLKPDEVKRVVASLQEEQVRKSVADTIEFINKSKPGKPGGDMAAAPPPGPGAADKKP
jgi:hypothetical protein